MTDAPSPEPKFAYPDNFKGFDPLDEQIRSLHKAALKVGLTIDLERALALAESFSGRTPLPDSDGFLARFRPGLFGSQHHQDIRLATELMFSRGKMGAEFRSGIDPVNFQLDPRTKQVLDLLFDQQQSDILIHSAQAGERYWHQTDEEVLAHLDKDDQEFCLDFLGGVSLLIGNPKRLHGPRDLWLGCPAERQLWINTGAFDAVPVIGYQAGSFKVFSRPANWPNSEDHGAATGFLSDL